MPTQQGTTIDYPVLSSWDASPPTGPLSEFMGRSISTAMKLNETRVCTGLTRGWSRAETGWYAGSTAKKRKKAAEAVDALLARKPELKADILNQLKGLRHIAINSLERCLVADRVSPKALIYGIEKFSDLIERLGGEMTPQGTQPSC